MNHPERPLTEHMRNIWRIHVLTYQTILGAQEWVDALSLDEYLSNHGLSMQERDPWLLSDQPGDLQITGPYDFEEVDDLARSGLFAIVGSDKDALIATTYEYLQNFR